MNANPKGPTRVEVEDRDAVVLAHAVRLGIITALTRKFPGEKGTMVLQSFYPDGRHHRLFVAVSGNADGDNGYLMYTAPRTPQGRRALVDISVQMFGDSNSIDIYSEPLSPCRN